MSCFNCGFGDNCEHRNGLYILEADNAFVCCNSCGCVLISGSKEKVEKFVKSYQESPELF